MVSFSSSIRNIAAFTILGVSMYTFYNAYVKFQDPCDLPITYTLSSFDERFNISREDFLKAVEESITIWEEKTGKDLFAYNESSADIGLRLIYDERQLATNKLDTLDSAIDDGKESYESLKARYDKQLAQYESDAAAYDTKRISYEARREAYQKEVAYWNDKGGAPEEEYDKLTQEKNALAAEQTSLDTERRELNTLADSTNKLADRLNVLAKSLNKNIAQYNAVGKAVNTEFDQGLYERDANGERISIYQFDDKEALVHVLTHEFGHALDLEHSENQNSIMYYLHTDDEQVVTDEDVAAIKSICNIR